MILSQFIAYLENLWKIIFLNVFTREREREKKEKFQDVCSPDYLRWLKKREREKKKKEIYPNNNK